MIRALIRFVTVCGLALTIVASMFGVALSLVEKQPTMFVLWLLVMVCLPSVIRWHCAGWRQ